MHSQQLILPHTHSPLSGNKQSTHPYHHLTMLIVKGSALYVQRDRYSGSDGKESTCSARDPGSISGSGRSPGEVKGYLLQYSGLENVYSPSGHNLYSPSDMTEPLSLYGLPLLLSQ